MPEKLKQMEELWWAEAGRNNALPLNFSPQATVEAVFQKPSLTRAARISSIARARSNPRGNRADSEEHLLHDHRENQRAQDGADGVIVTQGGRFAGWGLVVLDGKPVWAYKNTQQPNDGIRISGPTS